VAVSLSSVSHVLERIKRASDIAFGTYVLRPDGAVQKALLAAARRGARVAVTLPREPYKIQDGTHFNAESARALRRAGAHVSILENERIRFHMKAAVCDGVAYLNGRNWTNRGGELVVADHDARDVALIRKALTRHVTGSDRMLTTRKDEALAREAALIRRSDGVPVIVESEHADASAVTDALRRHAATAPATLILGRFRNSTAAENALTASLRADGVDVRETGTNEKLALAGKSAWIGSANATGAYLPGAGQIEWGLVTHRRSVVDAVAAALRRDGAGPG
jgi:phospholipase D-like protein